MESEHEQALMLLTKRALDAMSRGNTDAAMDYLVKSYQEAKPKDPQAKLEHLFVTASIRKTEVVRRVLRIKATKSIEQRADWQAKHDMDLVVELDHMRERWIVFDGASIVPIYSNDLIKIMRTAQIL